MSARFIDIPAEQWEQEFFADELKEQRKGDRAARRQASSFAAAFDALFEVAGFIPEMRLPLHIFLSQTKGKAPDEEVMIYETDAGRFLPGAEGVSEGSLRKRWVRAWKEIVEPEMARTGKQIGRRLKGSIKLATRQHQAQKTPPVYFSEIAQAVVDVERAAARMNGRRRDERFKRAALDVWSNLPTYVGAKEIPKTSAPSEPRPERLAGQSTRRMTRWHAVTKEMIKAAQAEGPEAVESLRARLHAELETLFADADSVHSSNTSIDYISGQESASEGETALSESGLSSTTSTAKKEHESDGTLSESDLQISSENRISDLPHVDGTVHVEPEIDNANCAACGDVIHPERLEFDSKHCDLCGPPRQRGKPATEGQGGVIYAEDYEV